ncbi:uncharacterized protein LOC128262469 isoform X3 [Drosophila gunungcola]|uniref:uncharacterized protein LOC128262469 isoform X3 n=1 Tax=Drosophila gunungcola TaxID=103775 RepID=UPI0022E4B5A6|nr:uncharacterized protein LOC128262469 isoform X3 [Drosophila gunungcola]
MSRANNSKIVFKPKTSIGSKSSQLIDYERIQGELEAVAPTASPPPALPPNSGQGKLMLKLSSAKISLGKISQIPQNSLQASSATDAVRRKSAPQVLAFTIAPKVEAISETQPPSVPKLPGFAPSSGIRRSRTLGLSNGDQAGTTGLPTEDLGLQDRESCSGSEPTSSLAGGGSSTSPESLLDNILSGASSVSVQSSSSSQASNATVAQPIKAKEQLLPKRLLSLKASPQLRISPPTPDTSQPKLQMLPQLLLAASPRPEIFEAPSPLVMSPSRSPAVSPAVSPSPSITLRPSTPPENTITFTDDLKCGICLDVYTDPRTLHCLHSFCLQCLVSENFKDESFWDQDQARSEDPSCYSLKSEMGGSSAELTATVSPARQRGTSFSLRRKKSMDRLVITSKSEGKRSTSSFGTRLTGSFVSESHTRCIRCQSCNYPTDLPLGGVRQLPQNYLLVRRIEALRLQAGEDVISKVWCSLCTDEISATYHCISCTLNLCTLCKEAHERQRTTANHRMRSILELRRARKQKQQQLGLGDSSKLVLRCGIHTNFELKAFCTQCRQLACTDCLVLLHKGHRHETISRAIGHQGKLLKEATDQTRPLCQYAEHSIERLNEIARGINARCDDIQNQVERYMQEYIEALEVHRRTLIQQISRARESKVELTG